MYRLEFETWRDDIGGARAARLKRLRGHALAAALGIAAAIVLAIWAHR